MAVSFKKRDVFTVVVTVPVPNESGGFDEETFVAHFKHQPHEVVDELRNKKDLEVVKRTLVGWDMEDADSHEKVPYSEKARDSVMSIASFPYHTALAFFKASSGTKAKNS